MQLIFELCDELVQADEFIVHNSIHGVFPVLFHSDGLSDGSASGMVWRTPLVVSK